MAKSNKSMARLFLALFSLFVEGGCGFNAAMQRETPSSPGWAGSLADWLRRRIEVLRVSRERFALGHEIAPKVVPCDRLILILSGSLRYEVEGGRYRYRAGSVLYVPAWVQRGWKASGRERCELLWVEFGPSAAPPECLRPLHVEPPDLALEKAALLRLLRAWEKGEADPLRPLLLEAELKAILVRCLSQCRETPLPSRAAPSPAKTSAERAVVEVVQSLKTHFASPEQVALLLAAVPLSPNYFRRLFREQTGTTVTGYLTRLRMHEARYRLRETTEPVKEIARAVGYNDPLRFSKTYHQFWGRAPLAERGAH